MAETKAQEVLALGEEADGYISEGRFDAAQACLQQALEQSEGAIAVEEPWLRLDLLTMMAQVLRMQGRYQQAHKRAQEALTLGETLMSPDDEELAPLRNELGMCCKYLARIEEGLEHYHRALELLETTQEESLQNLQADIYHNIGGIEHAGGDAARGEQAARRGLALRERLWGPHHPLVAADLAALGALVEEQERLEEALQLYQQAHDIWQAQPTPDQREMGYCLHAMASVAAGQEQWPRATELYHQSLTLKRRHLGAQHPSVGITLNDLALAHQAQGRVTQAVEHLQEALEIFTNAFEETHPHVISCQENLDRLRQKGTLTTAS